MMELSKFSHLTEDAISFATQNPQSAIALLTGVNLES